MQQLRNDIAQADLSHWLARFEDRRVLVLGDIMLDRYIHGDVRRISPEAPIPVLRRQGSRAVLGGAANVARNIASLGARAILMGVVGDDAAGVEVEDLCRAAGGIEARLVRAPGRPTTVKTRFVSHGHQLLRLDEEEVAPPSNMTAAIIETFVAALAGTDVVVLSDYAKGVLSDAVLEGAITACREREIPVIVDPKRPNFAAYYGASVLTPNQGEAAAATGMSGIDDMSVAEAGRRALEQAQADAVLVTRSEKGLTLVRHERAPMHLPTHAQQVADVSGAGDTLVATFAIALAAGAPMPEAAMLANLAAGIVVGKLGTATVDHGELAIALRREQLGPVDEKVVDWPEAKKRVESWRLRGLRVGFTNGCFDLIHPGHVRLLAAARAQCDRLVVALNTDDSVRRLKGPERPIQNEAARATVMAGIAAASAVVLFDQDTPEELMRELRPDVIFKGADYTVDQVVGGEFVRSYGGQIALIPLEQGHSTTKTIRRITEVQGAA